MKKLSMLFITATIFTTAVVAQVASRPGIIGTKKNEAEVPKDQEKKSVKKVVGKKQKSSHVKPVAKVTAAARANAPDKK